MKKVIYKPDKDGPIAIVIPNEGWRRAFSVRMPDGEVRKAAPPSGELFVAVDQLTGQWPVPGVIVEWAETEDELVARVIAKDVPLGHKKDSVIIDEDKFPQDRTFRLAWEVSGDQVVVDMPKARLVHLQKIRLARNERLAALDGPWMRAMGRGLAEEADEIERRREALRNLPATVDLDVETPEELAEIWPEELR